MGIQDRDWYWDKRDAVEREGSRPKSFGGSAAGRSRMSLTWQITIGILAGLMLVGGVTQYDRWRRTQMALREFEQSMLKTREAAAQESQPAVERERLRRQQFVREEAKRVADLRALQQAQESAGAEKAAEASRRQLAWARFYRLSERCRVEASVECANEFIRSRRSFEAKNSKQGS